MRTVLVGELRTGRRITQIPVADAPWSMKHRGPGDISIDIPLDAAEFQILERAWFGGLFPGSGVFPSDTTYPESATPVWTPGQGLRPELLAALEPARCFLAIAEDGVILEAGPIWVHNYDTTTQLLTVKASGLWSVFDHRFVMGTLSSGWAKWTQTYTGLTLGTIAKRLVELLETHTGGELPIVFPDDETGSQERTYNGYELATASQRLTELMEVDGGPDIAFEPRFTEDGLGVEWVMRVGTSTDPMLHQHGDDHVWDTEVARGSAAGISVTRDAGGVASRSWSTGAGMDEALLISRATDETLLNAGFPLLEIEQARQTVRYNSILGAWARGALASAVRPTSTWRAHVRADQAPLLGVYRPGDWATIWVGPSNPYLSLLLGATDSPVPQRVRIMNVSGDLSDDVLIEFVPLVEAR